MLPRGEAIERIDQLIEHLMQLHNSMVAARDQESAELQAEFHAWQADRVASSHNASSQTVAA